jgi:3-phosphoglycerate kinase
MIGFTNVLNLVGRQTETEMMENKQVLHTIEYPFVPIFGGLKVGDYMGLIKNSILSEKVPHVLLGGTPGIIAFLSKDIRPGESYDFGIATQSFLEKNVSKALVRFFEELYRLPEGRKKLIPPVDFLVKHNSNVLSLTANEIHDHPKKDQFHVWSIGEKTAKRFVSYLSKAKTIYKKGPVGKCEESGFEGPERSILKAIMKAEKNRKEARLSRRPIVFPLERRRGRLCPCVGRKPHCLADASTQHALESLLRQKPEIRPPLQL